MGADEKQEELVFVRDIEFGITWHNVHPDMAQHKRSSLIADVQAATLYTLAIHYVLRLFLSVHLLSAWLT